MSERKPRSRNKNMCDFDKIRAKQAIKARHTTVKKTAVQMYDDDRTDEEKRIKLQRYIDNGCMPDLDFFKFSNILNVAAGYLTGVIDSDEGEIPTADNWMKILFINKQSENFIKVFQELMHTIDLTYDKYDDHDESNNGLLDNALLYSATPFKNSGKTPEENINVSDLLKNFNHPIIKGEKEFLIENETALIHYLQVCMVRLYIQQGLIVEKGDIQEDPVSDALNDFQVYVNQLEYILSQKDNYIDPVTFSEMIKELQNTIVFIQSHMTEMSPAQKEIVKRFDKKLYDLFPACNKRIERISNKLKKKAAKDKTADCSKNQQ